jgi:zinc/manganese transport system permease protein
VYFISTVFGTRGVFNTRMRRHRHRTA